MDVFIVPFLIPKEDVKTKKKKLKATAYNRLSVPRHRTTEISLSLSARAITSFARQSIFEHHSLNN